MVLMSCVTLVTSDISIIPRALGRPCNDVEKRLYQENTLHTITHRGNAYYFVLYCTYSVNNNNNNKMICLISFLSFWGGGFLPCAPLSGVYNYQVEEDISKLKLCVNSLLQEYSLNVNIKDDYIHEL